MSRARTIARRGERVLKGLRDRLRREAWNAVCPKCNRSSWLPFYCHSLRQITHGPDPALCLHFSCTHCGAMRHHNAPVPAGLGGLS